MEISVPIAAPVSGSTVDVPLACAVSPLCVIFPPGAVELVGGSKLVNWVSVTPKAPTSAAQKLSVPGSWPVLKKL